MHANLDLLSRLMTAIATTAIATYVAVISRRQWKVNQEKLRLDLYNRRFDIYLHVIDYYQTLDRWQGTPVQMDLQKAFIKAVRESRFMFPDTSGVHRLLEEFQVHAGHIVTFNERLQGARGFTEKDFRERLTEERRNHLHWMMDSFPNLEDKLTAYLNFHEL